MLELSTEFDIRERERTIELLEERQRVSDLELQKQRNLRIAIIVGFVLLGCIGILMFNRYRLKAQQALMRTSIERAQEVRDQLYTIDKLKDRFLERSSHELRSPLLGITGLAQSLIDGSAGELPAAAMDDLAMIQGSGRRLGALVEDILDLSRLQRGRPGFELEPLDVHVVADVSLTLAKPLIGDKPVELINDVGTDLPKALAAADRLQQVLTNLVSNAIRLTEAGEIRVSARVRNQELEILVSDSGEGFSAEVLATIFDPRNANLATVETGTSRGLGLAISKYLVELHGGKIWAESEQGSGSKFFFTLPICDETAVSALAQSTDPYAARAASASRNNDSASERQTILVVDDDEVVCRVMENHLTADGYRVEVAADGMEAVARLSRGGIDLVLMDVVMPRLSGFEVCRRIREEKTIEQLPIVLLSGRGDEDDRVAGFEEGANDYLVKPINKSELLARVRMHLALLTAHRIQAEEVKILRGLLPICSYCKSIRNEQGEWSALESYLYRHSEAKLTHGICPQCFETHYAEIPDA